MLGLSRNFLTALLLMLAPAASGQQAEVDRNAFVPVFSTNFPDPFILPHQDEYLAYATNAEEGRANVQMARSTNLVDWAFERDGDRLHDAMPDLPSWAREGWTWAPEVIRNQDHYLLYFTARERSSGKQCIGVASAGDPRGPFASDATEPLICQRDAGGSIDPHAFRDADGQLYLYYKNDGNAIGRPTHIYVQRLAGDGLSLTGEAVSLLTNDKGWEAHVIESPTMVRNGEQYVLFFSANHFGWEENQRLSPYAMGYARCEGPMGPCADAPENPILYSYNSREAGCLSGPGHQAVFETAGRQFMVFHAHGATRGCRRADLGRYMYIAPLLWPDGKPALGLSLRPNRN